MSSPETLTLVTTARQTIGGPRTPRSTGLKPAFPRKPFWTPHVSSLLMGPNINGYNMGTWTLSSNVGGNPGSGPNPKASTEPRRAPQTLPQLGRTLQGDGNMSTRGRPPR
jgi:hypothetical protein